MLHIDVESLAEEGVSHNPDILKRVIVENGQFSNLINFASSQFSPGQVAPGHTHSDMTEVFFALDGAGQIAFSDSTVSLAKGECVVVEPGEWHEVSNPGVQPLTLLYFGILSQTTG